MVELDQSARKGNEHGEYNWKLIDKIDKDNTKKLKELIKNYGWISINKFGRKTSSNAWLIAQHSDKDIDFQKYCLKLMNELKNNEVSKHDIAYLTDRILVAEGKSQRFGTQFRDFGDYLVLQPVEDIQHLNDLRLKMGLSSIEEHLKIISKTYNAKVYLKPLENN